MQSVIEAIRTNAETYGDKIAIYDEKGSISYAELWKSACGVAAYFSSLGLQKGDRIMIKAQPEIPTVIAYFGIHLAGLVNVPCEKTAGPEALTAIADDIGAALIIADIDLPDGYRKLEYNELTAIAAQYYTADAAFAMPQGDELCDILFTTGTTGKSKGVMISNKALKASCENIICGSGITEDTVYLIPVPINHANGIRKSYATLYAGATLVLIEGLQNLRKFYDALAAYKATYLLLPPSAVRMLLLLSAKELPKYADQIKLVHTSAAPFPEADKQKLCELLPKTKLVFAYGSSEVANVSMFDYSKYPGKICCVGTLNVNSKVKVVDDNGNEIQSSQDNQGILVLGGGAVMTGYFNAPELTAGVLKDGWVRTNDIGYFDEDGFLYVLGRADDVINVGGLKIAPTEVENVVMQYRGIAECACFGIDDRMTGKAPKLNIVLERKAEIDLTDFRNFLASKMEAYKIPKKIEIVTEIPKTSNGKINRKVLK